MTTSTPLLNLIVAGLILALFQTAAAIPWVAAFDGRPFRLLTVVDCCSREGLATVPRANFRAFHVVEVLDRLVPPQSGQAEDHPG